MSLLVTCPNCGPREVSELRCAGESTSRPPAPPAERELNDYLYLREEWFLAERHTHTNEIARTWHPEPA